MEWPGGQRGSELVGQQQWFKEMGGWRVVAHKFYQISAEEVTLKSGLQRQRSSLTVEYKMLVYTPHRFLDLEV